MKEEKKMKTVKIEVFGYEEFLEPKSTEDDMYFDAFSRYSYDHMIFNVDGTQYTPDEFSPAEEILSPEQLKEFKDFDVEKFFEESEAEYGMIYLNKAWTTIEVEIPEDEEFDPKKAAVVVREFLNLDSDYCPETVCAFAYDGQIYDCNPEDSNGVSGERIWVAPRKWGYIDKTGAWIVEPKFDEAYPFSDNMAKIQSDGKYGFIDTKGALVIEPKFDDARNFHDGLAAVKINDKWGFIDKKGTYAIEPKYNKTDDFKEGEAYVLTNRDEGIALIDGRGSILFGPKKISRYFAEGFAVCKKDDKYGFVDKSGTWVIQPIFEWAGSFSEGMAKVTFNDKYGYINTCGELVIEPQFEKAWNFKDGIALVMPNDKYGYINPYGEFVIEPQFEDPKFENPLQKKAWNFQDGMAIAKSDNKFGWIDKNGAWVINPRFDDVAEFKEGMAKVMIGRKYGYINTKGEMVIEPTYDQAWDFHEGVACVVKNGKAGYIDKTGNWVIEPRFEGDIDELEDMNFEVDYDFSEGFAAVTIYRNPIPDDDEDYYDEEEDYDDEEE